MIDFNIESLPVNISYIGETEENGWKCDQWLIRIEWNKGFWTTKYHTGLGLRRKAKNSWSKDTPQKPTIADVLESLFLDASAADYNFPDWCAEYGYSDDSIRALNVYRQCLETNAVLKKAFTDEIRASIQNIISEM